MSTTTYHNAPSTTHSPLRKNPEIIDPLKSSEELLRLKRMRKNTEENIKVSGKKLEYKKASMMLKKKLKEKDSAPPSVILDSQDNSGRMLENVDNGSISSQLSAETDKSKHSAEEHDKFKTIWCRGETVKCLGAPAMPDLQLRNEDFKNIGKGTLARTNEGNEVLTQDKEIENSLPFQQELLQNYCKLTDENTHLFSPRKGPTSRQDYLFGPQRTRKRRSSEPSYTPQQLDVDECLSRNETDKITADTNLTSNLISSNSQLLRKDNEILRRLIVEDASTNEKLRPLITTLRRQYHAEISRQLGVKRFGTEKGPFLEDNNNAKEQINQCEENQLNYDPQFLEAMSVGSVHLEELPSPLRPRIQELLRIPKRIRRHSYSESGSSFAIKKESDIFLMKKETKNNIQPIDNLIYDEGTYSVNQETLETPVTQENPIQISLISAPTLYTDVQEIAPKGITDDIAWHVPVQQNEISSCMNKDVPEAIIEGDMQTSNKRCKKKSKKADKRKRNPVLKKIFYKERNQKRTEKRKLKAARKARNLNFLHLDLSTKDALQHIKVANQFNSKPIASEDEERQLLEELRVLDERRRVIFDRLCKLHNSGI